MDKEAAQKRARPLSKARVLRNRKQKIGNEVLIRWIHDNAENPYPTALEKQYLAKKSGKTGKQVKDWFPNTRRKMKEIGKETWLCQHPTLPALSSNIYLACNQKSANLSSDGKTASFSPPEVVAPPGSKGQLEFQPSGITPISGKKEELPAVSSYSVGYPMESYQDKSALWNVELKVQDKRAETNKTVVENEVALSSGFVFRCHSFPTQQHTSILSHSSMSAEYEGSSFGGMISSYPPTTYPFSPTIYTEQSMSSSIPTLSHIPHPDPLPSPAYNPQPSSTFYPNSSQQVLASGQVDCKFCVQVSHNVCQRQPAAWSGTLQSHL